MLPMRLRTTHPANGRSIIRRKISRTDLRGSDKPLQSGLRWVQHLFVPRGSDLAEWRITLPACQAKAIFKFSWKAASRPFIRSFGNSSASLAAEHPQAAHLVLCTNGVVLPRTLAKRAWIDRLGTPLTLKLSLNHHLLEHDPVCCNWRRICETSFRS